MTTKQEFPTENVKTLSVLDICDRRADIDCSSWQWRELARLTVSKDSFACIVGDDYKWPYQAYKPVPWDIAEHELALVPHLSVTKGDGMVAFTESAVKGEADRQTLIKVGRYLARYRPDMPQALRERYSAQLLEKEPIDTATLHFATTGEDMIRVYRNGPKSCMRGNRGDYTYFPDDDLHPVQVYAAGDLKLAYLTDASGKIYARALCWPEKEVYGRLYPTSDCWSSDGYESPSQSTQWQNKLAEFLEAEGMKRDRHSGFNGAKLARINHPDEDGVIMPYLDNDYGVDDGDDDNFTMHSSYEYNAQTTCGWISMEKEYDYTCECCGDGIDDTWSYVTEFNRYGNSTSCVCESCFDNNSFRCEVSNENYSDNRFAQVTMHDGRDACLEYIEREGNYAFCEGFDRYYPADDIIDVEGESYSQEYIDANKCDFHFDTENDAWISVKGIYDWKAMPCDSVTITHYDTSLRQYVYGFTPMTPISSFCAF